MTVQLRSSGFHCRQGRVRTLACARSPAAPDLSSRKLYQHLQWVDARDCLV